MPSFNKTTKNLDQTYVQACEAMKQRGICSYRIYANPEYTTLVQELDQSIKGSTRIYVERIKSAKVANEALFEEVQGRVRSSS
jgi:hypothetical protein